MTFKEEFLRYQLAQWEGVRNMLREKQLEDLAEIVGDDWAVCVSDAHPDDAPRATHWMLMTCGCDSLICTPCAEEGARLKQEIEAGLLHGYCTRCGANPANVTVIRSLT